MRLALQTIYRKGPTSRAEIARETELAKATVSDLVGLLLDDGLVVELGTGISAGGKPPTLVSLAPKSRNIVALDLSTVPFTGAIADLKGAIEHRVESTGQPTGDDALEEVGRLAEQPHRAGTVRGDRGGGRHSRDRGPGRHCEERISSRVGRGATGIASWALG